MYKFNSTELRVLLLSQKNMKIKHIADQMQVSYQTISDILNGKANPTVKILEKLMEVCGLVPNDLFKDE